jgi:hypothetical protein
MKLADGPKLRGASTTRSEATHSPEPPGGLAGGLLTLAVPDDLIGPH